MTATVSKSNAYGIISIGGGVGVVKSALYAVLSPPIQITKANAYLVVKPPDFEIIKIGRPFPFSLGRTVWAVPFYFRPKGF